MALEQAYSGAISPRNTQAGFCGAGIVLFSPEAVILEVNVRSRMPTTDIFPSLDTGHWASQMPHNQT